MSSRKGFTTIFTMTLRRASINLKTNNNSCQKVYFMSCINLFFKLQGSQQMLRAGVVSVIRHLLLSALLVSHFYIYSLGFEFFMLVLSVCMYVLLACTLWKYETKLSILNYSISYLLPSFRTLYVCYTCSFTVWFYCFLNGLLNNCPVFGNYLLPFL